ncbi:MAG: sugar transferase [Caldilinea sp.]
MIDRSVIGKSMVVVPSFIRQRFTLPPALRLRISERRMLLILVDLFCILNALWIAMDTVDSLKWRPELALSYLGWFAVAASIWLVGANIFDLYDLARASNLPQTMRSIVGAWLFVLTICVVASLPILPALSRSLLFIFATIALLELVSWRLIYIRLFMQPWFRQRALIVGASRSGRDLAVALHQAGGAPSPYRGSGYEIVGFVDDDPVLHRAFVEGAPVFGNSADLFALIKRLDVDEVIVAITNRHAIHPGTMESLVACAEHGCKVTTMSALSERVLGRVPVFHIGHNLEGIFSTQETAGSRLFNVAKRMIDIGVASVGLLALAPILLLVLVANRLVSPGPLFYRQVRVGRGGKSFTIYKLRSMTPDAEAGTGAVWAAVGDSRITPVGRWLRRTRLDELPQVINVLRGEMSIVGPRPERPEFVEQLAGKIPFYRARHGVRPGLTGWAQVQYGYGRSVDDARIKLEYDLYYVRHAAPLLDLQILFRTLAIALQMKGS